MNLDYDPDLDRLIFTVSPMHIDTVKRVPGLRYKTDHWEGRPSWATCLALRTEFGDRLEVTDRCYTWAAPIAERAEWVEFVKAADPAQYRQWFSDHLYDFQVTGALLLNAQRGFVLGDERRNGKTVQVIDALKALNTAGADAFPALAVVTNTTKLQWASEFEKFFPEGRAFVMGRTKKQRDQAIADCMAAHDAGVPSLLICGWGSIRLHSKLAPFGSVARTDAEKEPKELNGGWLKTVVVDEAHRLKDPKAAQTRAVWSVAHEAEWRWCLTATPLANEVRDLWSIFHAVAPDEFPSRSQFQDRYVLMAPNGWGGVESLGFNPATKQELDTFLNPRYLRRPFQGKVVHLPPQYRFVEMEPKQAKAYKAMQEHMLVELESGILVATNPLVKAARLRQLAAGMAVMAEDADGFLQVTALEAPSAKADGLADLIAEDPDMPLVVFAEHSKVLNLMAREMVRRKIVKPDGFGLITGSVPDVQRAAMIEDFQEGRTNLIMLTVGAGSEGVTLSRADTICFVQRPWSLIGNIQAEGRILSQAAEQTVQYIDIITLGTIEEHVYNTLGNKEALLQDFHQDPDWLRRELTT